MQKDFFPNSIKLFERASAVIPGGIYGHTNPAASLPAASPYFAERAEGAYYWDIDGNKFIDLLCGYGPILLGYNHPEVEEAAAIQASKGNVFNHPGPVMVDLAEKLVSLVDFASWCVFGKNGADMITWGLQVAREHTGRKKVLKIAGAYHGTHAWCSPSHGGIIEEDREHVHAFKWNDLDSFYSLIHKYRGQIAAVVTTAFHHPIFGDSALPNENFFPEIQAACRREGIILILDDVRSGFRLHIGGSHRYFSFTPDLICFSKALGNGHPISAALGTSKLHKAATRVFLAGSFWQSAVPMAASLKCLEIIERDNIPQKLEILGQNLKELFLKAAAKHGFQINYTGANALPFVSFSDETNFVKNQIFCRALVSNGVFVHPHHNWFLSAALSQNDLELISNAADFAFEAVRNT